jgi:hypothetical protein
MSVPWDKQSIHRLYADEKERYAVTNQTLDLDLADHIAAGAVDNSGTVGADNDQKAQTRLYPRSLRLSRRIPAPTTRMPINTKNTCAWLSKSLPKDVQSWLEQDSFHTTQARP